MEFDIDLEERRKKAAQNIAKRQALAASIAELKAKQAVDRSKALAIRDAALEADLKAYDSWRAAVEQLRIANVALDIINGADNQRIGLFLGELIDGASPEIDVFIAWCREDVTATRAKLDIRRDRKKHFVTGEVTFPVAFTNEDSVAARLTALAAAMEQAELLKLEPDQGRIEKRLADIRKTIPAVQAAQSV